MAASRRRQLVDASVEHNRLRAVYEERNEEDSLPLDVRMLQELARNPWGRIPDYAAVLGVSRRQAKRTLYSLYLEDKVKKLKLPGETGWRYATIGEQDFSAVM